MINDPGFFPDVKYIKVYYFLELLNVLLLRSRLSPQGIQISQKIVHPFIKKKRIMEDTQYQR